MTGTSEHLRMSPSTRTTSRAHTRQRLAATDTRRFDVQRRDDQQTGTVTPTAASELLLEIILDRLKGEFLVEATVGRPRLAYA